MRITDRPTSLTCRARAVRLLVLILVGFAAILYVALFAVPAICPDATKVRTKFTTGTVMPGATARPGLHFGSVTAPYDDQTQTRYVYVRFGSKLWLYECIATSQP